MMTGESVIGMIYYEHLLCVFSIVERWHEHEGGAALQLFVCLHLLSRTHPRYFVR